MDKYFWIKIVSFLFLVLQCRNGLQLSTVLKDGDHDLVLHGIIEDSDETIPKLRNIVLDIFRNDLKLNITENDISDVHRVGERSHPLRPVQITFFSGKHKKKIIETGKKEKNWISFQTGMYVNTFSEQMVKRKDIRKILDNKTTPNPK